MPIGTAFPKIEAVEAKVGGGLYKATPVAPQKKYNILKIAPTSFFADYGCHVRIYEESRVLQSKGNRVTLCTYPTGDNVQGLDIRRGISTPWNKAIRVGSSLHKIYQDVLLALEVVKVGAHLKPDLVHAHLHEGALIGWFISRLWNIPLVFDFQGSLTSEMVDHKFVKPGSLSFYPLRWLEARINHMADAIIASSYNAAAVLVRDFHYPPHKVFTIPDSVDANVFMPRWQRPDEVSLCQLRKTLTIPPERKVVAYLGLLADYQGTAKLLQAAALLVRRLPVHFLIMGYPGEDYYRSMAQDLGLSRHVTFTGRIPYGKAPQYLLLGDIAVSPKLSETEGNGKLLNYMAAGLPTVTFDTPVAREILGDLGIYAKAGDTTNLARAMEFLLTLEPDKVNELAHRLRTKVITQYSWERAGERLEIIYNRLCS